MKTLLFLSLSLFSVFSASAEEEIRIDSETEILRELDQIHSMGSEWNDKLQEARSRAFEIDPTIVINEGQLQEAL